MREKAITLQVVIFIESCKDFVPNGEGKNCSINSPVGNTVVVEDVVCMVVVPQVASAQNAVA